MCDKMIINIKITIFKSVYSWEISLLLWQREFQKFRCLKLCFNKSKGKTFHIQTWECRWGSRRLRLSDFLDNQLIKLAKNDLCVMVQLVHLFVIKH
jgi:hypothetical protein